MERTGSCGHASVARRGTRIRLRNYVRTERAKCGRDGEPINRSSGLVLPSVRRSGSGVYVEPHRLPGSPDLTFDGDANPYYGSSARAEHVSAGAPLTHIFKHTR